MRRHLGALALCGALFLLPLRGSTQRPPDEGQRIRLGITVEQQKRLEAVFSNGGEQREAIQSRLHGLYHDLHELYGSYNFNKQQAQQLRDQILAEHRKMLALIADNEAKLRGILSAKQFEKLHEEMRIRREQHHRDRSKPGWNGEHPPGRPEGSEPPPQGVSSRKG